MNLHRMFALLLFLVFAPTVRGDGNYLAPEQFLSGAFGQQPAQQKVLWINGGLRDEYRKIAGEEPSRLRIRYWSAGDRTAWILEAIGKERPITAGFVVEEGRLVQTRVLQFRESRGWEIRLPAFTAQFHNARLDKARQLDRTIDGISGATLSVRAMKKMARLALLLHRYSRQ